MICIFYRYSGLLLKKLITGRLESVDGPLLFKPNHCKILKKISKFFTQDFIRLESTSECCTNCGIITTRLNPDELNRFLLKNNKPEYLKQLYSCDK